MPLTRRDFLKASSVLAAALGCDLHPGQDAFAAAGGQPVVWLQAQSCSGCSISLLNSIHLMSAGDLFRKTLDLKFHPTLMSAAGDQAVAVAQATREKAGYILVIEGAIPTADDGAACTLWPGTTALQGVRDFAQKASFVVAVGTCASYGGVAAGAPNLTGARSVKAILGATPVINVPGCPTHPDWVVGTIAQLLKENKAPALDGHGRPRAYFRHTVHEECPYEDDDDDDRRGRRGHETKCLRDIGCRGPETRADCPACQWNGGTPRMPGVNWCVAAGAPCLGCTEPTFPDGVSPFRQKLPEVDD